MVGDGTGACFARQTGRVKRDVTAVETAYNLIKRSSE
jgi:hypothetical protein